MKHWTEIPLDQIKGVGPKLLDQLSKKGIQQLGDLLFHLPYRYEDRSQLTPGRQLNYGHTQLIRAEITGSHLQKGRRSSLVVDLLTEDNTPLHLRFFHFNHFQAKAFKRGDWVEAFGEVKLNFSQQWELIHPQYKIYAPNQPPELETGWRGIYASTEGFSQFQWRKLMQNAFTLDALKTSQDDLLFTLRHLHFPESNTSLEALNSFSHPLQQQLVLEELTAHRLALLQQDLAPQLPSPALVAKPTAQSAFLNQLPFCPTQAQWRVCKEISEDLSKTKAMLRLVQGDVGSGKTLVAALAALQTLANGYQVALMAPTELLAQQHYKALEAWFKPLGYPTLYLSGSLKAKEKKTALAQLENTHPQLIIGTHALFQEHVKFGKLGLAIIDEQHRFGVEQRLRLSQKAEGYQPHQLILTATPIPRTLAMSAYGHIALSVIDELPAGRLPIRTSLLANDKLPSLLERIHQAARSGQQIYWVCPLIEDNEELKATASEVRYESLRSAMPDIQIGHIHGKLKEADKQNTMQAFINNQTQILVATTVIEVGVNVPNATIMVIEDAQRMGLAQLHQLRGRVGRGSQESYCLLLYSPPLNAIAQERLALMRETQDGFLIAEKDLELRGAGEILGKAQTGVAQFRLADLTRDYALIEQANAQAQDLLNHPKKAEEIKARWLYQKEEFGKA